MIKEFIDYIITPSSDVATQFGYLKEVIAIKARFARNKYSWQTHLQSCHELIVDFCNLHPNAKTISILGSGHLHEIPIEKLLESMQKIYLYDLVFPRAVRNLAAKSQKIQLVEKDLSGCLDGLRQGKLRLKSPFLNFSSDLVVSANILSQLPILPQQWILNQNLVDEEEASRFSKEIIKNHLRMLQNLQVPTLLYSDVNRLFLDASNNVIKIESSLNEVTLRREVIKNWQWDIAPSGEISKDFSLRMQVEAFYF